MSGKAKKNRFAPLMIPPKTNSRRRRISNIPGEFVPLNQLIHSLDSNRRLYFLYRQAAETGSSGARLRFQRLVRTLGNSELRQIELSFKTQRPIRTA
jgi:hypothetical protein